MADLLAHFNGTPSRIPLRYTPLPAGLALETDEGADELAEGGLAMAAYTEQGEYSANDYAVCEECGHQTLDWDEIDAEVERDEDGTVSDVRCFCADREACDKRKLEAMWEGI